VSGIGVMPLGIASRVMAAAVAVVLSAASFVAAAQPWSLRGGFAARAEYSDNYFFTSDNRQSALTGSLTPFVTAERHGETSDIAAIAAVGANKVWGVSPPTEYVSSRIGVDASLRDARSLWAGSASFVRTPSLQATLEGGTVLGLAYTNATAAKGAYTYQFTDNVSIRGDIGGYSNRYTSVADDGTFSNNRGAFVGGGMDYAYSDRTRVNISATYLRDSSDTSHSDSVTGAIGVAHQISPRWTVSVSAGGYSIDTTSTSQGAVAPHEGRATGGLFGGHMILDISERSQLTLRVVETVAPSGIGVLSRSDDANATLTHRFSDRLSGRLGASFRRTRFPQASSNSSDYDYYRAEVGVTYLFAERWLVEAGYRHDVARYAGNSGEPRSNVAFISIAYNWPGGSVTSWVGAPSDTGTAAGVGPLAAPDTQPGTARDRSRPGGSQFEQNAIP
jgi:hypothetical protein